MSLEAFDVLGLICYITQTGISRLDPSRYLMSPICQINLTNNVTEVYRTEISRSLLIKPFVPQEGTVLGDMVTFPLVPEMGHNNEFL